MEIKACPWCGEAKEVAPSCNGVYWVECFNCGATGPVKNSEAKAIDAWNALPRPEPWLDAPDGPGWWWYAAPWSEPEEIECRVVRKRKDGTLESYDPWQPCEPVGYEGYRTTWEPCTGDFGCKWQRAHVPTAPEVE